MWFNKRGLFFKNSFPGHEVEPEDILMDALNPEDFNADQMEGRIESALGKYPFIIASAAVALGIAALVFRAGFLQLVKGGEFAARARDNRFFTISLPAPRGLVYDAYNEPIVKNTPSFEVVLKRNELPETSEARQALAEALKALLKISAIYLCLFHPRQ